MIGLPPDLDETASLATTAMNILDRIADTFLKNNARASVFVAGGSGVLWRPVLLTFAADE